VLTEITRRSAEVIRGGFCRLLQADDVAFRFHSARPVQVPARQTTLQNTNYLKFEALIRPDDEPGAFPLKNNPGCPGAEGCRTSTVVQPI
jgi:hypothetical protein